MAGIILTYLEDTTIKDELKTYEDLFKSGDYQKTLDWLNQHPKSFSAETWHYNMGVGLAKLEKFPEARAHWEEAYQLGKRDTKTAENLRWVTEALESQRWETLSSWPDYVYKFLIYRPQYFFTELSLAFIALGIGLFTIKKISLRWMSAFLIAAAGVIGFAYSLSENKLLITQTPTAVFRGPSQIFDSQEVPPGIMLYVKPFEDGQYKVLYPSSAEGWILNLPKAEIKQGSIWDLTNQK